MNHLKLFKIFESSGDLDHDFEIMNDLISDLEIDLDIEYKISYYEWDEDSYIRKKESREKEMISVLLKFKKDFKVNDFTKIVFDSKYIVDFINKNVGLKPISKLKENNLKIREMKMDLVSNLRGSKFIQRLEELSNYELVNATYVEIIGTDNDGLNFVRSDVWGARFFFKHIG